MFADSCDGVGVGVGVGDGVGVGEGVGDPPQGSTVPVAIQPLFHRHHCESVPNT